MTSVLKVIVAYCYINSNNVEQFNTGEQPSRELLQGGDDEERHPDGVERQQDLHEAQRPHPGEEVFGGQGGKDESH